MINGALKSDNATVLLVDDAPDYLMLLKQCLAEDGYEIRMASSGSQALSGIGDHPPDIVLLDINMPEMDGYEVCKALKADDQHKDIPVIFISTLESPEDKVKAFEAGGIDYVCKPVFSEEVRARVATHLKIAQLQQDNEDTIERLEATIDELKQIKGLLPICSNCKSIRDDEGYWNSVEKYFEERIDAEFSHSFCPECAIKLYAQKGLRLDKAP